MNQLRPVKACHACGASYTLETWKLLRTIDPWSKAPDGTERRLCVCGEVLTLNLDQAAQVADAMPEPEQQLGPEPPPEALDDEPPAEGMAVDRWGYHMEEATAILAYVRIPLVPYPKRRNDKTRARDAIELMLGARALLDQLIAQAAQHVGPPPAEVHADDDPPPPSNLEGP